MPQKLFNNFVYGSLVARQQPLGNLLALPAYHAQRGLFWINCGINAVIIQPLFSSGIKPNGMILYPRVGVMSQKELFNTLGIRYGKIIMIEEIVF